MGGDGWPQEKRNNSLLDGPKKFKTDSLSLACHPAGPLLPQALATREFGSAGPGPPPPRRLSGTAPTPAASPATAPATP